MAAGSERERAMAPEDIPRLWLQFVQAGDFDGLATLYEPDAVMALPPGAPTRGNSAIAQMLRERFAAEPLESSGSELQPVLRAGDFALTSTHLSDGRVTAEIAHRQPDGSWRWVIDQPNV